MAVPDVPHPIQSQEIGPSPDFDEYAIAAGDFDVTTIGGFPVRLIEVAAGSGTLNVRCRNTNANAGNTTTWRTASGLVVGSKIGPGEFIAIAGTTNGSSAGLTLRIYK